MFTIAPSWAKDRFTISAIMIVANVINLACIPCTALSVNALIRKGIITMSSKARIPDIVKEDSEIPRENVMA